MSRAGTGFADHLTDLKGADESKLSALAGLVPMYEQLVSGSKIHMLQSAVSAVLMELVFDQYFVGLSDDEARQLTQIQALLSSFGRLRIPQLHVRITNG